MSERNGRMALTKARSAHSLIQSGDATVAVGVSPTLSSNPQGIDVGATITPGYDDSVTTSEPH